jgi:hypothetical protein
MATHSSQSGVVASRTNESVVKNQNDPERRAIALAWLFHLVGDIHQPLHTAQLFIVDYPQRDRGGNEICVRVKEAEQPMDPHRFWRDYLKLESDAATERSHGAPQQIGVFHPTQLALRSINNLLQSHTG